ncbi:MAG: hypothetical protein JKX68_04670 [Flavobacteriales bacterium]|nr:hypothetical protein [Flavobacteriales bacterium]
MKTHGEISFMIKSMFRIAKQKHLKGKELPEYDLSIFCRPNEQMKLF